MCLSVARRRPAGYSDSYGTEMSRVPGIMATIYDCAGCEFLVAGLMHDGVFLHDPDLVPLSKAVHEYVKYEQEHAHRHHPRRHEPGE